MAASNRCASRGVIFGTFFQIHSSPTMAHGSLLETREECGWSFGLLSRCNTTKRYMLILVRKIETILKRRLWSSSSHEQETTEGIERISSNINYVSARLVAICSCLMPNSRTTFRMKTTNAMPATWRCWITIYYCKYTCIHDMHRYVRKRVVMIEMQHCCRVLVLATHHRSLWSLFFLLSLSPLRNHVRQFSASFFFTRSFDMLKRSLVDRPPHIIINNFRAWSINYLPIRCTPTYLSRLELCEEVQVLTRFNEQFTNTRTFVFNGSFDGTSQTK